MKSHPVLLITTLFFLLMSPGTAMSEKPDKLQALLIDGQMNGSHNMALMSEAVTDYLDQTGLFDVSHVSTPPRGGDMSTFAPDFEQYDLVILNYDGEEWPEATKYAFERYMKKGGGLVSLHSSDNAFADWPAFLEMTGVGGWNGRDESWGPSVHWSGDGPAMDYSPGQAFHPPQHVFPITIRDGEHPVTAGLPDTWLHAKDELYSNLRGPARNLQVLATGFADTDLDKNSGRHEPVLMALSYGQGRVFHTTLGHVGRRAVERPESIRCTGFIVTLQRGAEWAASGDVTQDIPDELPGAEVVSVR